MLDLNKEKEQKVKELINKLSKLKIENTSDLNKEYINNLILKIAEINNTLFEILLVLSK